MSRHHVLSLLLAALVAACAEAPTRSGAPVAASSAPVDPALARSIARHRGLAEQYAKSGDLSRAASQWQALTLLDPEERSFRDALAATRAEIGRVTAEQLAAGNAALRTGDTERATAAMLRVLAADPGNAEAAKALREIERQRVSRTQADRSARARTDNGMDSATSASVRPAEPSDGYDLEQRIEMFRAGDRSGGLRELRRYVEAHPNDRAARAQIGAVVYERAREAEAQGAREDALSLYDQALSLRGEKMPEWSARAETLRRALGNEYYEKGVRVADTDMVLAIGYWETSLRIDPKNTRAASRLAAVRGTPAGKDARGAGGAMQRP